MKYALNEEGQTLYDEFCVQYDNGGCTCHRFAPCSYCTHPGNPNNLAECPEYHEKSED